jgi:hypothetical protein
MSQEQPMQNPALAARRSRPLDFARIRQTPGLGLIGLPELIGLAAAGTHRSANDLCLFLFLSAGTIASHIHPT